MDDFIRTSGTFFRIRSERVDAARFVGVVPKGFKGCQVRAVDGAPRLEVPTASGPLLAHLGDWVLRDGRGYGICDDLDFRRDWTPVADD